MAREFTDKRNIELALLIQFGILEVAGLDRVSWKAEYKLSPLYGKPSPDNAELPGKQLLPDRVPTCAKTHGFHSRRISPAVYSTARGYHGTLNIGLGRFFSPGTTNETPGVTGSLQMSQSSPDAATLAQRRKLWGKVLAFAALVVIVYLQPKIQAWLDGRNANGPDAVARQDADHSASSRQSEYRGPVVIRDVDEPPVAEVDRSEPGDTERPPEPTNTRITKQADSSGASATATKSSTTKSAQAESEQPLGKLREIRNNVFESTAGLRYVPGSVDSHRLRHVMQHAEDDTSKPVHGVFDGDRDKILATIDEGYQKALKGGREVRSEEQNDRLVYTVNLGRKIGYAGGSEGKRQRNPECRYLRVVLEDGNVVISAYPTKSF